jgi:pilus assembly protein CpaB
MKWKTSVSLMVAVVLGLITAKVGTDMLKNYRAGTMGSGAAIEVIIAKKDFQAGHVLDAADLGMRKLPGDLVPATAFRKMSDAVGRTVITPVVTGQTMFEGLVAPPGSAGGIQALIPPGMRLVTVDVSESSGLAGQVTPGCRVDLMATLRKGDSTMARTIVENVKVSAVSRGSTGRKDDKTGPIKSVTLIVKPKEAATIELASAQGKPRLVLRNTSDTTSSETSVTQHEMTGEPEPAMEPSAAKPPTEDMFENKAPEPATTEPVASKRTVQIIRGSNEQTIAMPLEQEEGAGLPPTTTRPAAPKGRGGTERNGEDHRRLSDTASDPTPRTDATP